MVDINTINWLANLVELDPKKHIAEIGARFNYLLNHRLECRLALKLSESELNNTPLMKTLNERYQVVQKRANIHIEFLKSLNQKAQQQGVKIILLKGVSISLLLNNPKIIRYSHDIDIIASDVNRTKELLLDMGFVGREITVDKHEDSSFMRKDILIDVHKFFPIISPPANIKSSKTQLNIEQLSTSCLTFEDLEQHSTVTDSYVKGVYTMTLEFAVLISCLHMVKDFYWEPYKGLKLSEMLDVYDAISSTDFSQESFMKLVNIYGVEYHVGFVFSCIKNILKYSDALLDKYSEPKQTLKLMNDSFGPYLLVESIDYYINTVFGAFEDKVKKMQPLKLKKNNGIAYPKESDFFTASTSDKVELFSVDIQYIESRLIIIVASKKPLSSGSNCFIKTEEKFSHIWFDNIDDCKKTRIYGDSYNIKYGSDSTGSWIKFEFININPKYIVVALGRRTSQVQYVSILPVALM